jgi:hypothetical protein
MFEKNTGGGFVFENVTQFPNKIFDGHGLNLQAIKESSNVQTIISENGSFNIQSLNFKIKKQQLQKWALDIQLFKLADDYSQTKTPLLYPFTVN